MRDTALPYEALNTREIEIVRLMAQGLTNREIADRLVIGVETVRWYAKSLYGKLDVSSRAEASQRAAELGLLEDDADAAETVAQRTRLPVPLSSFIGRTEELQRAHELLAGTRLLTLTGPGGTGKTRLSLHMAEHLQPDFRDGAVFVDLTPVVYAELVPRAIAEALDIAEIPGEPVIETIIRHLATTQRLIILDNFEQVISAAPLVGRLLQVAPGIKIIVTSREALRINGEQEYPVPPLTLPQSDHTDAEQLLKSEAVALFVQRVQAIRPNFELDAQNAATIGEICHRLDGLPLAIELAAARCKLLSPQALLARLDHSLETLVSGWRDAPQRQQTLRATIDWSYNLLNDQEKRMFSSLAAFCEGRSLDAISFVYEANDDGQREDLVDLVASLVDKNLVRAVEMPSGEPRFVMLETLREYGQERLRAENIRDDVHRRHAEYFAQLCEQAEPQLRLADHERWHRLIFLEMDNIRTALNWSRMHDPVPGVRIIGNMLTYWYGSGNHVEAYDWLQAFEPLLDQVPAAYHAQFYLCAGHIENIIGNSGAANTFSKAAAAAKRIDDPLLLAQAMAYHAYTMHHQPEAIPAALDEAEEALTMLQEIGHQPGIAQALNVIGELSRLHGDLDRARRAYETALAVSRETGETRRVIMMHCNLAFLANRTQNYAAGLGLAQQGLRLALGGSVTLHMAYALLPLSTALASTGEAETAARILGAVEAEMERLGAFWQSGDVSEYNDTLNIIKTQMSKSAFEAAWQAGRSLTMEAICQIALGL